MTVRNIINAALIKFYTKLNKKVLTTLEEIEANTDSSNFAGATAVAELSNNLIQQLGGFTPIIDKSTGKITGYTTEIGGADTVFPFSNSIENFMRCYLDSTTYISGVFGYLNLTGVDTISYVKEGSGGYKFNLVPKQTFEATGRTGSLTKYKLFNSDIAVTSTLQEYDVSNISGEYYIYYYFSGQQYATGNLIIKTK